jgi:hypothetical protein
MGKLTENWYVERYKEEEGRWKRQTDVIFIDTNYDDITSPEVIHVTSQPVFSSFALSYFIFLSFHYIIFLSPVMRGPIM